jgi:hypothetical protein
MAAIFCKGGKYCKHRELSIIQMISILIQEQYQYCYQMALAYLERQPLGIDRQTDRQNNDSIDSGIQDKLS